MDAAIHVSEVPATRALGWLGQAFHLFRRQPTAWIGLTAGWLIVTFGMILVPLVGGVLANFFQPAFFASFAVAAMRQEAGGSVSMGDLFAGFRRNLRSLVNLGALLLIAEIAIFALMAVMGLPLATDNDKTFTLAEYVALLKGKEWILAVGFLLTVAVKGALWFAPPLIAFHDMTTMHAIRWSVFAALSNLGAMMAYGTALMALFFVSLVPWALGLLIAIPMMAISTYVGYREVFGGKQETLGDRPPVA